MLTEYVFHIQNPMFLPWTLVTKLGMVVGQGMTDESPTLHAWFPNHPLAQSQASTINFQFSIFNLQFSSRLLTFRRHFANAALTTNRCSHYLQDLHTLCNNALH